MKGRPAGALEDPGRIFLSLLGLWFALVPGSLPGGPEGWAADARAFLAAASVLLLPGALLGPALAARGIPVPGFSGEDGFLARLAGSAALSLCLSCPAMFALLLAGAPWGAAEGLFRIGVLALLVLRWRSPAAPSAARFSGPGTWLLALAGIAAAAAWRMGAVAGSDAAVHRAVVRALLRAPSLGSPAEILLSGEGADPRYALPVWHALLALSARVAAVDPDAVWHALPGVLSMAPVGAAALLGARLLGSGAAGVRCGLFALLFFAGLGHPATRLAGYYQMPAHYLIYPCAWAALLGFLREGDRRGLSVLAALSFASAAVNPFYGFVLLAVSLASAGAWLLAARRPWRPLASAGAAALLAGAPVMALRARGVEVRNAAYASPESASDAFRAKFRRTEAGLPYFAPAALSEAGFWGRSLLVPLSLLALPLALRGRLRAPGGAFLGTGALLPVAILPCPFLCAAFSAPLSPIYTAHLVMLIPVPYLLAAAAGPGGGTEGRARSRSARGEVATGPGPDASRPPPTPLPPSPEARGGTPRGAGASLQGDLPLPMAAAGGGRPEGPPAAEGEAGGGRGMPSGRELPVPHAPRREASPAWIAAGALLLLARATAPATPLGGEGAAIPALLDRTLQALEGEGIPWPHPLARGPKGRRPSRSGGTAGRAAAEARGFVHAALLAPRVALWGPPWEEGDDGMEDIAGRLRGAPRGVVLSDSDTALEIAARTGFPAVHVPPYNASPSAGDLPDRLAAVRALLGEEGSPGERLRILDRWSVRYAVLPADAERPESLLPGGWRRLAGSGPWILLGREGAR